MRLTEITVPEGCRKIYVDVEDDKVVVSYASSVNNREFYSSFTRSMEERPGTGDFCVMWNNEARSLAVCVNLKTATGGGWLGSDGVLYDQAVKFRDYKQYLDIKGVVYED